MAEIVVVPVARLVTSPALLMVAVAGLEELQATEAVMSCVLLSLNVPVAVNALEAATGILELAGVTAIVTSFAPVTVTFAVPLIDPEAALIVAVPEVMPLTIPLESTVATAVAEEPHVSEVSNCVLPSSKMPVAESCWLVPAAMVGVEGEIEIEVRCAATTVRLTESLKAPTVAEIVVVPAATVFTSPEVLIVATPGAEEFHVTFFTKSWLLPSL